MWESSAILPSFVPCLQSCSWPSGVEAARGWPLLPSALGEPDTYPLPSRYTERVPEKFDCRSHNQGEPLSINHSSLPCPGLDSHVPDTSWPSDALWDFFRAFTSLPYQEQHYLASLYHTDVCFQPGSAFSRHSYRFTEGTVLNMEPLGHRPGLCLSSSFVSCFLGEYLIE